MILILENNENKTTRIECLTAKGSEVRKEKVMGQSLDTRDSEINRKCIQSKWNVNKW